MLSRKITFLSVFLVFACTFVAVGQAANSPFSSFGIGAQFGSGVTQNLGMGGVGYSNPSYWYINNMNPALLPYNQLVTFQVGVVGEERTQNSNGRNEKSGSGNLNNITLAVPVLPGRWTSSISLMPYSSFRYVVNYTQPVQNTPPGSPATIDVNELGAGGISAASWSNGVYISKNFSVGLKASYLFGAIENTFSNTLSSPVIPSYPKIYERTSVSGFQFSPGVFFRKDSLFGKNYVFNVGIVYETQATVNANFLQQLYQNNAAGSIIDSLTLISNAPGKITLPSTFGGGISFGRFNRWTAAFDASYSDYSVYKGLDGTNPYKANSWRVAAGFELTPDPTSLSSYLKRMTYRTGFSLENSPIIVNGNPVRDLGISFGLSLPVSYSSSLDFGLKVGKKGDKTQNLLEENYLRLYFGITFMDRWFIKRRFD